MTKVKVFKIPIDSPDDVSGLRRLVEETKELNPHEIVAILGKTEGNGCVNDFTRGFCIAAIQSYLQQWFRWKT
jgi:cyanuric acid amidohydrolase